MSDFWHYSAILLVYLFPALVLVAALNDLLHYQIPNWIPISILVIFFPISYGIGWPLSDIGNSFLCFLAMLVFGFILFALRLFGGGDAKLIAASSIWIGWELLPSFVMLIALIGGALALVILLFRRLCSAGNIPQIRWVVRLHDNKSGIPYALAIAGATLILFVNIRIAETIFNK